jgi:hypothetical protein
MDNQEAELAIKRARIIAPLCLQVRYLVFRVAIGP